MNLKEALKKRLGLNEADEESELHHHPLEIKYHLAERTGVFLVLGSAFRGNVRKFIDGPVEKEEVGVALINLASRMAKAYVVLFATLIFCLAILLIQSKKSRRQESLLANQGLQLSKLMQKAQAEEETAFVIESGNISQAISDQLAKREVSEKRLLSPPLIGRIVAFSRMIGKDNAYDLAVTGTRDELIYSPERGNLLISLRSALLDKETYEQIYQQADFSYADLNGAKLWEAYFRNINLSHSNLNQTDLQDGNLEESDLQMAEFQGAFLLNVKMEGANLEGANLDGANLWMADLKNTNLQGVSLQGTEMKDAVLMGARAYRSQIPDFIAALADTTGMDWIEE